MSGTVIIGAGECGVRAAFALRENGYDGAVRLIGDEAHLPYERPPLSKTWPPLHKPIATGQAYVDAGIELMRGLRADAVDVPAKRITLSDGSSLPFEKLLIATGARPRVFPGMEEALTLRTANDAEAIVGALEAGKRIAIVGGGFIGLELAATARARGADVVVIEAADRLMARAVPAEIAAVAEARHRAEGVDIRLRTPVRSATAHMVELADGTVVEADTVVAGTGSMAVTRLAQAAGLTIDNGVAVDECFRTSAADIHAAGDCCSFPWHGQRVRLESWRAAQDQGSHAARNMLGAREPYSAVPWFWSDQYDITLQVAGLAAPGRAFLRRDLGDGAFVLFQLAEDGTASSVSGIGRGNAVARDVRLGEMMIGKSVAPDPAVLIDPGINLKKLLRG